MKRYHEAKKFHRFSDWLRVNAKALRMNRTEVATVVGLSQGYISQLMLGNYTTPTLGTIRRFTELFGAPDLDEVWDLCD